MMRSVTGVVKDSLDHWHADAWVERLLVIGLQKGFYFSGSDMSPRHGVPILTSVLQDTMIDR